MKSDRILDIAARSDATLLITGPTGSGKSTLAQQIHRKSDRRLKPFITINLASLHEGTLESELFGHSKGAFTGADQRRIGKLELGQGGTIFLDEIAELTPRLQARLLEFLQSKSFCPVGSNHEVKLDVRVICATHRDLELMVAKKEFREDLFHRIRVLSLHLESLSNRSEQFDEILHSCLEEYCRKAGRSVLRISEDAASVLENYDWPGNIRELRNVLEFAVLASEGSEITLSDLPQWFLARPVSNGQSPVLIQESPGKTDCLAMAEVPILGHYKKTLEAFEKAYLEFMLKKQHWKVSSTARQIGMSKTSLLRRLQLHGIATRWKNSDPQLRL